MRFFRLGVLLLAIRLASAETPAAKPQRIVSTAPSITETLFALGLGDKVVGVTNYCHYPPEANKKARIGLLLNPDIEAIVALHPDLVVVEKIPNHLQEQLTRLHIRSIVVAHDTLEDVLSSDIAIANAAGEREAGKRLNRSITQDFSQVRAKTAGLPKIKSVFVISHTPGKLAGIFVAGGKTYFSEMLQIVGAENVFSGAKSLYPQIPLEDILTQNPEAILETVGPGPAKEQELFRLWSSEPNLQAVQKHHVYAVPGELFEIPSPRIVEAVNQLAHILHPEAGL